MSVVLRFDDGVDSAFELTFSAWVVSWKALESSDPKSYQPSNEEELAVIVTICLDKQTNYPNLRIRCFSDA